ITIVPETPDQISFLRYVLDRFGRSDLPLGIFNINAKPALSKFHLKLYPNTSIKESREALDGSDVLLNGFAGDDTVPEEKRLSKFNGRITCPAFNLATDTKAAELCSYFRERKLQKFPLSSKSSEVKEKYFPRF
ncbi:unnamed protein product, partial [Rotaria socialis]